MTDPVYRLITLGIQMLAFVYLVFKLGRYTGEANMMFKTLFEEVKGIKLVHLGHATEDDIKHAKMESDIVDIRVEAAAWRPGDPEEKRQFSRRRGDPK